MNVCILQMLYFDGIDAFEGTDVRKTSALKECDIRHLTIVNIKGFDYCYTISLISKNNAINLIQIANLI